MLGAVSCLVGWCEHVTFTVVVAVLVRLWVREGWEGVLKMAMRAVRTVPGVNCLLTKILAREVRKFTQKHKGQRSGAATSGGGPPKVPLPMKGVASEQLLEELEELRRSEGQAQDGRMFALVYTGETEHFRLQEQAHQLFSDKTGLSAEHDHLVQEAFRSFMHENALNPTAFPALRRFENEVISMTAAMLNGDEETVGSLTSGGTESILMAMKAYRDRARKLWPHIRQPEMVAPITIHPAHEKAASYFGFKIVRVPVTSEFTPNMKLFEEAIGPNTIALLASAPQYCHAIVDPIDKIAALALKNNIPLHVDACFGGFMLPWVEKLGYPVPPFDFRVAGVTSISADIHKYGYGAKGASVVLYRNSEYRKYQIFSFSEWPGGLFGSPSMAGTRPGGNIAASWVALRALGEEGYMTIARQVMDTTVTLQNGIWGIPGLCILGKPQMSAFAIGSCDPTVSIMAVADVIETKGWSPERQQYPDSLHCTIMPAHAKTADLFVADLRDAVEQVKGDGTLARQGTAAMYGMVASIPDKSLVDDFTVEFFNQVYKL